MEVELIFCMFRSRARGSAPVLINKVSGQCHMFDYTWILTHMHTQTYKHTDVLRVTSKRGTHKHICNTDEKEAFKRRVWKLFTVTQA